MPDTLSAWAAIVLVAGVTLASRLSGPLLMARMPMSTSVERFLQNLSLSVIAALVASMLARGGPQIDLGDGCRHGRCCLLDFPRGLIVPSICFEINDL